MKGILKNSSMIGEYGISTSMIGKLLVSHAILVSGTMT